MRFGTGDNDDFDLASIEPSSSLPVCGGRMLHATVAFNDQPHFTLTGSHRSETANTAPGTWRTHRDADNQRPFTSLNWHIRCSKRSATPPLIVSTRTPYPAPRRADGHGGSPKALPRRREGDHEGGLPGTAPLLPLT